MPGKKAPDASAPRCLDAKNESESFYFGAFANSADCCLTTSQTTSS